MIFWIRRIFGSSIRKRGLFVNWKQKNPVIFFCHNLFKWIIFFFDSFLIFFFAQEVESSSSGSELCNDSNFCSNSFFLKSKTISLFLLKYSSAQSLFLEKRKIYHSKENKDISRKGNNSTCHHQITKNNNNNSSHCHH